MDRIRTGLTGLGLVFVFTLVASAMVGPTPTATPTKEASEPLAQLGVAPGVDKSTPADGWATPYRLGKAAPYDATTQLPGSPAWGERPIFSPDPHSADNHASTPPSDRSII